jgi:hypothetical protein
MTDLTISARLARCVRLGGLQRAAKHFSLHPEAVLHAIVLPGDSRSATLKVITLGLPELEAEIEKEKAA